MVIWKFPGPTRSVGVSEPTHPGVAVRNAAFIVPSLIFIAFISISVPTWIKNFATDDALYYPTVARNIVIGRGSTFDGITSTNGYQPLWCWLQVPIASVTASFGWMTYLWFLKLFVSLVVLATLIVWYKAIRTITGSTWIAATFISFLGAYWWSVYTLYSGMETPLVVLLIGLSLLLASSLLRKRSVSTAVMLGVASAATFLARLDSVFFLGVLGVVVMVALRSSPRLLAAYAIPAILLPGPYLWWNLVTFGNIVPVSGVKKFVSTGDLQSQLHILAKFASDKFLKLIGLVHPVGLILVLVVAIATIWVVRKELSEQAKQLNILWVLPAGACLHFLYIAIFMVEADIYWYQYSEYLAVFLIGSLVVASAISWLQKHGVNKIVEWAPFAAVILALLGILFVYAPRKLPNPINVHSYEVANWARDNLKPADPRFGMYDPGVFRAVSGFDTVALNGLAGDEEMMHLALQHEYPEMIRRYQLDYVVEFVPQNTNLEFPSQYVVFRSGEFRNHADVLGVFAIVDSSYYTRN